MKLESIGFYTMSDKRCRSASHTSPLKRCELILTGRCNFRCPYCRNVGGKDLDLLDAFDVVTLWAEQGLENIRFSGGEPTLWHHGCALGLLVQHTKARGIKRIAISTNGSAEISMYKDLISYGVNDISVSLDACCAEDGDKMAGGIKGAWEKVSTNLPILASLTYVTVGVVLTEENAHKINEIIRFAHNAGVADIRVIPAAQNGNTFPQIIVDKDILEAHPILKYRIDEINRGETARGLEEGRDSNRCGLVLDDMAVMGNKHYPCIIYMREGGRSLGDISSRMRAQRLLFYLNHDTLDDPICRKNCLDVCRQYNNKFEEFHV